MIYKNYTEYLTASLTHRKYTEPFCGVDAIADIALLESYGYTRCPSALRVAMKNVCGYINLLKDKSTLSPNDFLVAALIAKVQCGGIEFQNGEIPEDDLQGVLEKIREALHEEEDLLLSDSERLVRLYFLSCLGESFSEFMRRSLFNRLEIKKMFEQGRLDKLGLYGLILLKSDRLISHYWEYLDYIDEHLEKHEGLWFRLMRSKELPLEFCDAAGSALVLCAVNRATQLEGGNTEKLRILSSRVWRGVKHNIIPYQDGFLEVRHSAGHWLELEDECYLAKPVNSRGRGVLGATLLAAISSECGL